MNAVPFNPRLPASSANGMPAAAPSIQAEHLTVRYGSKIALEDVSLEILPNRILALVGPSGCGKTSFLNCLNRLTDLIPGCKCVRQRFASAMSGSYRLPTPTCSRSAAGVGMIFQKPNPFPFSIRRNLEFPLREHGTRNRGRLAEIAEKVLRDVGLWDEVKDRLNASALSLSGGQQQRLCIARALALQPEILLARRAVQRPGPAIQRRGGGLDRPAAQSTHLGSGHAQPGPGPAAWPTTLPVSGCKTVPAG